MNSRKASISRRNFLTKTAAIAGTVALTPFAGLAADSKMRIAIVGTGVRALNMWSKSIKEAYPDRVEFVGLCDINPGRLKYFKNATNFSCPIYTDFEKMMKEVKPDTVMVTTVDSTHHEFIIKGMEMGANIITEKPMTTDEKKCQAIMDAEKRTGKKVTVTFNYRYTPHRAKIYELLQSGVIGDVTSVDFHWYLDTSHGSDYFRRWHRLKEKGGTLWVHKSTHHFDLLNWWLESDPEEVYASGSLDFYGKNSPFRYTHCRPCPYKEKCNFYFDITKKQQLVDLYVENEEYDGYLRDGCVWKEDINIYDKMAATIKYANGVHASYSLTTYSPYEGYRIAFNGKKGRIDLWVEESNPLTEKDYEEIIVTQNFGKSEIIKFPIIKGGHGGGDKLMADRIFGGVKEDPYRQAAGVRDGALSILTGIAARKSCESGKPVKIKDLTSIKPQAKRQYV